MQGLNYFLEFYRSIFFFEILKYAFISIFSKIPNVKDRKYLVKCSCSLRIDFNPLLFTTYLKSLHDTQHILQVMHLKSIFSTIWNVKKMPREMPWELISTHYYLPIFALTCYIFYVFRNEVEKWLWSVKTWCFVLKLFLSCMFDLNFMHSKTFDFWLRALLTQS